MLSLHLLQVSLVYVNTLMIQQVLVEPAWRGRLTAADPGLVATEVATHKPLRNIHFERRQTQRTGNFRIC
jgi:hypothetical protein